MWAAWQRPSAGGTWAQPVESHMHDATPSLHPMHFHAHLLDVGHQVVGDAHRMLSQVTAGVGTHRVEVPVSTLTQQLGGRTRTQWALLTDHVSQIMHNRSAIQRQLTGARI